MKSAIGDYFEGKVRDIAAHFTDNAHDETQLAYRIETLLLEKEAEVISYYNDDPLPTIE